MPGFVKANCSEVVGGMLGLPHANKSGELPTEVARAVLTGTTARIQHGGQVTIPTSVRRKAGLGKGDIVNFAFQRGKIIITPEALVDVPKAQAADDEYTPRQRRIIDARLAKSLAETKAGRVSKAYSDHREFIAALHEDAARLQDIIVHPKQAMSRRLTPAS